MKKQAIYLILFTVFTQMLNAQQPISIIADDAYKNVAGKGEYLIFRDQFTTVELSEIRKPLIFIEGIDANQDLNIQDLKNILYYPYFNGTFNTSLGSEVNNLGYDIVILNFSDGADFIQRNAFVVEKLIKEINSNKQNQEPITVVGYSMGGLVARYALTDLEAKNIEHETKLFISFDSPQKGAHIPVSVQALTLLFDGSTFLSAVPEIGEQIKTLKSNAAKQMLRYRLNTATDPSSNLPLNPDYIKFMDELIGLNNCNGFPIKSRNIGISLGSWNGKSQQYTMDKDNNAILDNQHSGFPIVQINGANITTNTNSEIIPIWNASPCELSGQLAMFLSTTPSKDYPDYINRQSYTNLLSSQTQIEATATFFLFNSLTSLLPQSFSRFWAYENEFKTFDFAPGSYLDLYKSFITPITNQLDCSRKIADNCTFIPTNSALCYNSKNLFEDIGNNPNKLDNTPFDDIYALEENAIHSPDFSILGPTVHDDVNKFLLNELSSNYGTTCAKQNKFFTGIEPTNSIFTFKDARRIELSNYTINSNSNIKMIASEIIEINNETIINGTDEFVAEIGICNIKSCAFVPTGKIYKKQANPNNFQLININPIMDNVEIYPNPVINLLNVNTKENSIFTIYDIVGKAVQSGKLNKESNKIDISIKSGIYFIAITNLKSHVKTTYKFQKL